MVLEDSAGLDVQDINIPAPVIFVPESTSNFAVYPNVAIEVVFRSERLIVFFDLGAPSVD
jgi:hypothetical protein